MPASWLATWLDAEHLYRAGATIYSPLRGGMPMPPIRSGREVARELGGRLLLHYLGPQNLGKYQGGRFEPCYATPTAYAPSETKTWLQLPGNIDRTHVLILDPEETDEVQGPYWVADGRGIQYRLPNGFERRANVVPGSPGVQWETEVV